MKLFMSSANGENYRDCFKKNNCKFYLWSYLYLKNKEKSNKIYDWLGVHDNGAEIFIDSGAFTLMKPNNNVDWDKFIFEYCEFINHYSNYIDYVVELDIDHKVGIEVIEKWNDIIVKKTGRKPVSVYHKKRSLDFYKFACRKYGYVGYPGIVFDPPNQGKMPSEFINVLIQIAHKEGAKIHGFGYTRADLWKRDFDSVDSTSWASISRYGALPHFDGTKIVCIKSLHDFSEFYPEVIDISVREWVKYQAYLSNQSTYFER